MKPGKMAKKFLKFSTLGLIDLEKKKKKKKAAAAAAAAKAGETAPTYGAASDRFIPGKKSGGAVKKRGMKSGGVVRARGKEVKNRPWANRAS